MAVQFNGSQFHANNNNERRRRDGNDPALPLKNLVIILSIVAIAIGGYMVWRRSRRGPSTAAYYAAPVSFAPSAPYDLGDVGGASARADRWAAASISRCW
eukprot:jgi/Mesvir1/7262/Mv19078-RA.1